LKEGGVLLFGSGGRGGLFRPWPLQSPGIDFQDAADERRGSLADFDDRLPQLCRHWLTDVLSGCAPVINL
jgi:hypothetical protein